MALENRNTLNLLILVLKRHKQEFMKDKPDEVLLNNPETVNTSTYLKT